MKLDDVIKIIPPTKKGIKQFRTNYYEAKIGEASAHGATSDEAINNLKGVVRQAFEGDYSPSVLTYRGLVGIAWRELHGWCYKILEPGDIIPEQEKSLWGCTHEDSQKEAMRRLRFLLAELAWDGQEEYSSIILGEDEQARFAKAMRWQKRYRSLKETGMEDNAIRNQLWDEGL